MTPTNELRFLVRTVYDEATDFVGHDVRILQQKWIDPQGKEPDQWRDVPEVEET